jgi:hypothetical protein
MSWFSWHEPLITPAQFAYCVLGVVVIDILYLILRKAMKEGEPSSEMHEHVNGDGR